jgi:hypothetical protein
MLPNNTLNEKVITNFRGVLVIHSHQNSHSFLETMKISSFYLDNKMEFEAIYEKLCEPSGNKDNKQSDFVKLFLNSECYSKIVVPRILFIIFVF